MSRLTVAETAKHFRVSSRTVLRWLESGKLRGVRLPSGRWRVPAKTVERLTQLDATEGERLS